MSKNETSMSEKPGLISKIKAFVKYCISGVWSDPRNNWQTRTIKTLNLTVSSFFDRDLQNKSMALTYSTVLSLVPALAMLVAIGRGFGMSEVFQNELYSLFPSQHKAISVALKFCDSYLTNATQGMFVGIGLLFLLWTVISLLFQIEDTFNAIWGIRQGRTIWQKVTDYIAICLIIPVLLVCSAGISLFMTDTIQDNIFLPVLTPMLNFFLELIPFVLSWLAFTLTYCLIPNTKVQFKYAAMGGLVASIGFTILQFIFLNSQMYLSNYNAIYGSFAFLPLMLLWLQFSWLLLLSGALLTYSVQNVMTFNPVGNSGNATIAEYQNLALIMMGIIAQRFVNKQPPLTENQIAIEYYLPLKIVSDVAQRLRTTGLIYDVDVEGESDKGLSPALGMDDFSVEQFLLVFDGVGKIEADPAANNIFPEFMGTMRPKWENVYSKFKTMLVKDLPLPSAQQVKEARIRMNSQDWGTK